MAFPNIQRFLLSDPGPYERQMGGYITASLQQFNGAVHDAESNTRVLELASDPTRWLAGHAAFDEMRGRLLAAMENGDRPRQAQYAFEESCCQAIYNATDPPDPFDPSAAFFVVLQAIDLAEAVGLPVERVLPPNNHPAISDKRPPDLPRSESW